MMIEQNLSEDPVDGIPEPLKSKQVEKMTKTPLMDEVSSTLVPFTDQTHAATATQPYSSLVSVRDFSAV